MSNIWIEELDILRGVGILGVAMIHIAQRGIFFSHPNLGMNLVLDGLSRFAVPFFIFVSGTSFSYNYHNKEKYFLDFIYKRLRYIGIPYLVWSAFGFLMHRIREPKRIAIDLLTGNAMWHLYFVVLIFSFYTLSPAIMYLCKHSWRKMLTSSLIGNIALLAFYIYFPLLFGGPNISFLRPFINPAFWLSYFVAGVIVGMNMESFREYMNSLNTFILTFLWFLVMIISVYEEYAFFVNTGKVYHFFRPANLLYSFMSVLLCWKLFSKSRSLVTRFLPVLGRYSFGIYLVHIPVLYVIYHKLTKQYYGNIAAELFTFLACVTVSFAFSFFISRTRIGILVVGKVR